MNNNQISSIKITDGDKPTSVNEASRAEDPEGPLIVSNFSKNLILKKFEKDDRSVDQAFRTPR